MQEYKDAPHMYRRLDPNKDMNAIVMFHLQNQKKVKRDIVYSGLNELVRFRNCR
jgi:(2Fe-2S) ferredoxin